MSNRFRLCKHSTDVRDPACPWCRMIDGYRAADAAIRARREQGERDRLARVATELLEAGRKKRDPHAGRYFHEEVEMVLHAAGVVEVVTGCYGRGIVTVKAQGLLGNVLREDQVCEVLERVSPVLRATGYLTGVKWDADPPRVYVTTPVVQRGLFD